MIKLECFTFFKRNYKTLNLLFFFFFFGLILLDCNKFDIVNVLSV